MSSPMSNLPIQNLPSSSGNADFASPRTGPSSSSNSKKTPRNQYDQTNPSTQRGRHDRNVGGKPKNGQKNQLRPTVVETTDDTMGDLISASQANTNFSGNPNEESSVHASNAIRNRQRVNKTKRGSGGKFTQRQQRQQTNELLEGIIAGQDDLEIDFVESLMPTSQDGRVSDYSKARSSANSRKVNLTHLLNNRFERQNRNKFKPHQSSSLGGYRNQQFKESSLAHKFSKQQFLQANCQFVVLTGRDYTIHKVDPDWPVEWDCIEEVRFKQSASTETTCPICLEPPIAAKITRCGHIYCWTCMLHYLSLSDENCRQCPICFEAVYKEDLRSVVSHSFFNHSIGEEVTMRLMLRKKGCVEVEPYRTEDDYDMTQNRPLVDCKMTTDNYWSQANLVIVDSVTVIERIANREYNELHNKLKADKGEPEECFIEQALRAVDKRIDRLQQSSKPLETDMRSATPISDSSNGASQMGSELSKSYLFYQCSDGQHIYLNPFCTKILCQQYGSLENCPLEIQARVLQMDWISMNDFWRKRFKYLEHLPLTCEFRLIEIDFEKSNIVSNEVFRSFENQIISREQERERRRREERKREKIIQVEQNRRIYGIQQSLKISLNNMDQFPSISDERYLGLSHPKELSRASESHSTSDEEEEDQAQSEQAHTSVDSDPVEVVSMTEQSSADPMRVVTLSFKEIQLQEEALAAQLASETAKSSSTAWSRQGHHPSGNSSKQQQQQHSSFAQLLVNAKVSQKQWTRKIENIPQATSSNNHRTLPNVSSDDDLEGTRAPPSEFTISDFIDLSVKKTTGKGKKVKKKN